MQLATGAKRAIRRLIGAVVCAVAANAPAQTTDCDPPSYTPVHVNGVNNVLAFASANARALDKAFGGYGGIPRMSIKGKPVAATWVFHNPTDTLLLDLIQSAQQRGISASDVWRSITSGTWLIDPAMSWAVEWILDRYYRNPPTIDEGVVASHALGYRCIISGRCDQLRSLLAELLKDTGLEIPHNTSLSAVIAVPHSQGNLYVNAEYSYPFLSEMERKGFGTVGVAVPADQVKGYASQHITAIQDLVVQAVESVLPNTLGPNISIPLANALDGGLGHAFREVYLSSVPDNPRLILLDDVRTVAEPLKTECTCPLDVLNRQTFPQDGCYIEVSGDTLEYAGKDANGTILNKITGSGRACFYWDGSFSGTADVRLLWTNIGPFDPQRAYLERASDYGGFLRETRVYSRDLEHQREDAVTFEYFPTQGITPEGLLFELRWMNPVDRDTGPPWQMWWTHDYNFALEVTNGSIYDDLHITGLAENHFKGSCRFTPQ